MRTVRLPTQLKRAIAAILVIPVLTVAYAFKIEALKAGDPIHEGITTQALNNIKVVLGGWGVESFERSSIKEISDATAYVDVGHANDPAFHFDSESFAEASNHIRELKQSIVRRLLKKGWFGRFVGDEVDDARDDLGTALHIIQDFFAHSNWVERHEADPSLPMPAFGMAKDFVFAGIDAHQLATGNTRKSAQIDVRTCDGNEAVVPGTLSSGYYSFQMSGGDIDIARGAGLIYDGPAKSIDVGVRRDRGRSTDQWKTNAVDDGWGPAEVGSPLFWPIGKCIHGGEPGTPGLNKDEPDRDRDVGAGLHQKARDFAQQASEAYVNEVLRAIRLQVPDADAAICALIGRSGSAVCKKIQDAPVTTISGFNPPTEGFIGQKFLAAVTGNLAPNLSVRLGTVDCRTMTEQTRERLDVECLPYANGIFDLTVRSGTGETFRADKITIYAAKIEALPASANMFDRVQFTITNYAATIFKAILSFFDTLGNLLGTSSQTNEAVVKNGTSVIEPGYIFDASGQRKISAELSSVPASGAGAGSAVALGKTNAVTIDIKQGVVASVAPLIATAGQATRFDVYGSNLGSDLGFKLEGCENTKPVELLGELTTHQAFVCTFPAKTAPGKKNGAVGLKDGTPFDKALKAFSVDVSAPPAPAAPLVFYDSFDGNSLNMSRWTVAAPVNSNGTGQLATYSVSDSFLNVNVGGGSCGACGVGDGIELSPNVAPLNGDFEVVVAARELERLSRDGTRTLSAISLNLRDGNYQLGVYVQGDARNNMGAPGHVITMFSGTPGGIDYVNAKELTVGQYYGLTFRVRRVGGQAFLAYRLDGENSWTEVSVRQSMPANLAYTPRILVGSGDGGGTRVNSSFKAKLDFVSISGTGGTAATTLYEPFDRPALDLTKWKSTGGGTISISGSYAAFSCFAAISTQGKVLFDGNQPIVIESRFAGEGHFGYGRILRDTYIALVDSATPSNVIQFGDTNYQNNGLYSYGAGVFSLSQQGNGISTGNFMEYRITLAKNLLTIERGASLTALTEKVTRALPATIEGRQFYLTTGVGGPDYCPGTMDWISVSSSNMKTSTTITVPASANPGISFKNPFASKPASCSITATGAWNNGPTLTYGPDGAPGACGASCMFPNAPALALTMLRTDGSYVVIGSSKTVALGAGEAVSFWNNDGITSYFDNQGSVQATATCD